MPCLFLAFYHKFKYLSQDYSILLCEIATHPNLCMKFLQTSFKLILFFLFFGIMGKGFLLSAKNHFTDKKTSQGAVSQLVADKQLMDVANESKEDDSSDSDSFLLLSFKLNAFNFPVLPTSLSHFKNYWRITTQKLYLQHCILLI